MGQVKNKQMKQTCKNCGADISLHQFESNKCPLYGKEEIRPEHKQQWNNTTFEVKPEEELIKFVNSIDYQSLVERCVINHIGGTSTKTKKDIREAIEREMLTQAKKFILYNPPTQ